MIAHHLAIALRRCRAAPFTTLANVATLAVGLACFIAAYGVATYWRSGDAETARTDRVVVISLRFEPVGQTSVPGVLSPTPLGRYLREEMPELEHLTRATGVFDVVVAAGDNKALLDAAYVDPELLDLFDLELVAGDARTALAAPGGVVLTADTATRLFGAQPALGKPVRVDDSWDGTVTGVLAPIRQPSFMGPERAVALPFSMLANRTSAPGIAQADARDTWFASNSFTLAAPPETLSLAALNERLAAFSDRHRPQQIQGKMIIEAFPIGEITTRRLNSQLLARNGIGWSAVSVLLGLGVLTLAIAAVSYANLASAQAVTRAKEVGMRRVLGSGRVRVMAQSWLEAGLQTSVAAVLALGLLLSIKPWIEASSGIGLLYFLTRGAAPFVVLAAVVAIVSLIAGAYPALVLSRIPPLDAVQPGRSRGGPRFVAQILVGLQFASASFLAVVVTIMHLQRASLEDVALLPHRDPVIVLNDVRRAGVDFATLESEVRKIPTVKGVASISANPWSGTTETIRYARDPAEGSDAPLAQWRNSSEGYFAMLGLEVLAGRVFESRDAKPGVLYSADDTNNQLIVVDRTYAERLGFSSPADAVDALVYVPENLQRDRRDRNQPPAPPARIIGVTETETTYLEAGVAEGVVHVFAPELRAVRQIPLIRVARNDLAGTVAAIAGTWDSLAPKVPANVRFFDDLFELRFRTFAAVSQLFVLLAASAVVIAAIGQLGIAVHVATRRRREVGLRKTLGSSTSGVIGLLLVDFGRPVVLANLAAWPAAYLAAGEYLQAFAYRIAVTPWPFVLSLGFALAIAFGAVIAVVLKTARLRPADVLRQA